MRYGHALLACLPHALSAALFLLTWIRPRAIHDQMLVDLTLVMLLEFIVLHSAAFMTLVALGNKVARSTKVKVLLGFAVFYALFAGAWSLAFKTWWPLLAFAAIAAGRIVSVTHAPVPTERQKTILVTGWVAGLFFYVITIAMTALLPMPRFGVTDEVARSVRTPMQGEWVEEPHLVAAAGFLYFLATAIVQFRLHKSLRFGGKVIVNAKRRRRKKKEAAASA